MTGLSQDGAEACAVADVVDALREMLGPFGLLAMAEPTALPGFGAAGTTQVAVRFPAPLEVEYKPVAAVTGSHVLFDAILSRPDQGSLDASGFVVEVTASGPLPAGLGWVVGAAIRSTIPAVDAAE